MKDYRARTLIFAMTILVLLVIVYVLGVLIPDDAIAGSYLNANEAPSLSHFFGTDALGRDLFLRTLKGLSVSITIGIVASLISGILAMLVGLVVATGSKWLDAVISWTIDLVMSVPHTIAIILISFACGRGLVGLLVGISATHWCTLARLIRAEVLKLHSQQYIAISRKLGRSSSWIWRHHILPHIMPQLIVGLVLMFPHAILHEASISFLGFGLPVERAAIGIILSESMRYLSAGMWWSAVLPGLTLVLVVLLIDKMADCLRMIMDPYTAQL